MKIEQIIAVFMGMVFAVASPFCADEWKSIVSASFAIFFLGIYLVCSAIQDRDG